MRKIVRVTEQELAEILINTKVLNNINLIASIWQATEPKMTVKSRTDKSIKNPFGNVTKLSKVSILLNSNYEKAVTNQLLKENKEVTDYQKGINTMPIEFGENNQFIGTYKGEWVLQYRPNDNIVPKSKYIADGKLIDKAKLVDFLPLENKAQNQGTDREIFFRKLYLKNVRQITLNKITYKIIK